MKKKLAVIALGGNALLRGDQAGRYQIQLEDHNVVRRRQKIGNRLPVTGKPHASIIFFLSLPRKFNYNETQSS
jgi:hypothetical protein